MTRFRLLGTILMLPVLGVVLATAGCGGDKKATETGGSKKTETSKEKKGDTSTTAASGPKTALKPAGFATIKGKITYDGDPPPPADIRIPDDNKAKAYCLTGPHTDPT